MKSRTRALLGALLVSVSARPLAGDAVRGRIPGPLVLAVLPGGRAHPLAYAGPKPTRVAPEAGWNGTASIRGFIATYLAAGRRYHFFGEGVAGSAIITGPAVCRGDLALGHCDDLSAPVRVEVGGRAREGMLGLAAERELRSLAPASRRPLDEGDRRALAALAEGELLKPYWGSKTTAVTGFAQDLDGDGVAERVGIVRMQAPAEEIFFEAILARPDRAAKGGLRLLQSWSDFEATDARELGTADLDADGKDDVVLAWIDGESWYATAWSTREGFALLQLGGGE